MVPHMTKIKITEPGVYDIPDEVYFGDCSDPKSINASALKVIAKDGLAAYWEQSPLNPNRWERPRSDALEFGRMLHMRLFEPERYKRAYIVAPGDDFRTKEHKAWAKDYEGEAIVKPRDAEMVDKMISAVLAVPQAAGVLTGGVPERSYYDLRKGLNVFVKSKIDYAPTKSGRFIADLKSTSDLWTFEDKALADYRYDIQAAVQIDSLTNVSGVEPRGVMYFAAAKQPPHTVRLLYFDLKNDEDRALIQRARHQYTAALEKFAEACQTGKWTGEKDVVQRLYSGASPWIRQRIERDLEEIGYD